MTPRAWKRLFARVLIWGTLIAGTVFIVLLAQTTWHVYTKEREARQAHLAEAESLSELKSRQQSLSEKVASLDTSRGVEAEVRDRYPVAKSGEQVIILTDNPNVAATTTGNASASLWGWFAGLFSWL